MIGAGPSEGRTAQPFGGTIDEVQILDRALTGAEIEGIFNAANAGSGYQVAAVVQDGEIERTVSAVVVVWD